MEQNILNLCLKVNGITAFYPLNNKVNEEPLEPLPSDVGKYGWNNGRVAFVTPEGDYYVSPYCIEVASYLSKHGYEIGYIYVPFSNDDVPSDRILAQSWMKLCIGARELHNEKEKERRKEKVKNIAKNKNIKNLSYDVYNMSLLIPDKGLKVKYFNEDDNLNRPIPDFDLKGYIGTYHQNNGRIVFIDDNGKTYVSPYAHEVRIALENAGYRDKEIFVPLSNGEEIANKEVKNYWEKLCMGAKEAASKRMIYERSNHLATVAIQKGVVKLPNDAYRLVFEIPKDGVDTIWYGDKHDLTKPISDWELDSSVGTYCQNNGKIVFIDDAGRTLVTPFANEVRSLLMRSGYKEKSMFVPFSNGEVPSNELFSLKWKQLCNLSRRNYEDRVARRKVEKINKLARSKGILELPSKIYELTLQIPKEGFETIFFETERDFTRPVYDWELERSLGTYCQNNGRLVFVNDKGDTFVTPHCEEVRRVLEEHGYKASSLFVPLSNGERIINKDIAKKWDILCSRITN